MKRTQIAVLTALGLFAALAPVAPSQAASLYAQAAEPVIGERIGTTMAEIERTLVDKGYRVREIEREDGRFEVYIIDNGKRYELKIDATSGEVVRIEREDRS